MGVHKLSRIPETSFTILRLQQILQSSFSIGAEIDGIESKLIGEGQG